MDKFLEFLQGFNVQTILSLGAMMWYFTHNMKNEMKAIEAKLDQDIKSQSARSDRLYEMFIDLLKERKNG